MYCFTDFQGLPTETSSTPFSTTLEIAMHIQTRTAQLAVPQQQMDMVACTPRPASRTRMILIAAAVIAIGWSTWGLLRAEFAETLHMISMHGSTPIDPTT